MTSQQSQGICNKCFQLFTSDAFEEHQKSNCFPLMLMPMKLTLTTTVPVNVLAHLLERFNIKVSSAEASYPDTVYEEPFIPPSPVNAENFSKFQDKYSEALYNGDEPIYPEKKKTIFTSNTSQKLTTLK